MKITKYYQSCLLIEDGNARILIDPSANEAPRIEEFGHLDAVLYTHEHNDHFDPGLAQQFQSRGVALYSNASTARLMRALPVIVKNEQEFVVNQLAIKAIELPHSLMPDGSEGPQNTGYLLNGKLFHPGDGKETEGLQVENIALPITGPDISIMDAYAFARQVNARTAIAIHWHTFGANPELYARFTHVFNQPFELKVLEIGESTEL